MQHGTTYRGQRLRGWIVTEKLDGIRAYWCGQSLWTRGGHPIALPRRISRWLPLGTPLDGELYAGPGGLDAARNSALHGHFTPEIALHVFDAPSAPGNQLARLAAARTLIAPDAPGVTVVPAQLCESERHAARLLGAVHARGGEGIMLSHPRASYAPERTRDLVKLKRPYYAAFLGTR